MPDKIFGREPALIIGAINAFIMFAGTLGYSLLGQDQALLWVGVVNAVSAAILAWTTRPLSPAVYSLVISTFISLGASYGFTLSPEQVNGLNGLLVPILLFITRGQVSPIETKITNASLATGTPDVQTVPEG